MINDPHLLFCKKAVILLNLGGPGSISEVRPFLFNLFNDPAIIRLPNPFRFLLAWYISKGRTKEATEIYEKMGGKSPILENTLRQADQLQDLLSKNSDFVDRKNNQYRVFVCMRYSNPRSVDVVKEVAEWNPDEVILLPLYPQYSTTTTQSSVDEWNYECSLINFDKKTTLIKEYYNDTSFISAHIKLLNEQIAKISDKFRILFSAHSLPQNIIDKGDPYQKQVITSVESIVSGLGKQVDYQVCYQSKVGRLKWLEPSTVDAIKRAAKDGIGLIVVPIAFVSEHSETLVELDIEYRELAHELGIPFYIRIPTLSTHPDFIKCLADLCLSCGKS